MVLQKTLYLTEYHLFVSQLCVILFSLHEHMSYLFDQRYLGWKQDLASFTQKKDYTLWEVWYLCLKLDFFVRFTKNSVQSIFFFCTLYLSMSSL